MLILALGRGSTDRALMNDRGQYFPVRLELARLVSSLLYGTRTMLVLNLPALKNKKIHSLWKRSVWRNPDQEGTNQNARICLRTSLPYNKRFKSNLLKTVHLTIGQCQARRFYTIEIRIWRFHRDVASSQANLLQYCKRTCAHEYLVSRTEISLGQQHGCQLIALEHQYGCPSGVRLPCNDPTLG